LFLLYFISTIPTTSREYRILLPKILYKRNNLNFEKDFIRLVLKKMKKSKKFKDMIEKGLKEEE
jgi:hypothetical protein